MLTRSFDQKYKNKFTTYANTTVCDEWLSFSNFWEWLSNQEYHRGWSLDKDIIGDGTLYSPNTCILIPQHINTFLCSRVACRGKYPLGVSFDKRVNKYVAHVVDGHCVQTDTPDEARELWLQSKYRKLDKLRQELDEIDSRLYPAMLSKIPNIS